MDKKIKEFLKRWNALPPLVRASTAGIAVTLMARNCTVMFSDSERYRRLGMERRSLVAAKTTEALQLIGELMVELGNEADREAVSKGIDLDTGEADSE